MNKQNWLLVRSNGGSCNGSVTYHEEYNTQEAAQAALEEIENEEEEYCAEHEGAWHTESIIPPGEWDIDEDGNYVY